MTRKDYGRAVLFPPAAQAVDGPIKRSPAPFCSSNVAISTPRNLLKSHRGSWRGFGLCRSAVELSTAFHGRWPKKCRCHPVSGMLFRNRNISETGVQKKYLPTAGTLLT